MASDGWDASDVALARWRRGMRAIPQEPLLLDTQYRMHRMVKAPSLAGQSSPSQPPHMEAFGSRLLYTLWRSHGATPLALRG